MRSDPKTIVFGLKEFTESSWQTLWGMGKTPFIAVKRVEPPPNADDPHHKADVVMQQRQ